YDGPAGHWGQRRLPLLTSLSRM
ncbi:hypothetical protein, partial [Mycobacterium tuberculosis]